MDGGNKIFIQRTPIITPNSTPKPVQRPTTETSFQDILNQKINENTELKWSKHAENRLRERGIKLTDEQMNKLKQAVAKADSKGVKDSLIMVDNIAMVVSVKNKTVITVADSKELKENVFTNIDGAVII